MTLARLRWNRWHKASTLRGVSTFDSSDANETSKHLELIYLIRVPGSVESLVHEKMNFTVDRGDRDDQLLDNIELGAVSYCGPTYKSTYGLSAD